MEFTYLERGDAPPSSSRVSDLDSGLLQDVGKESKDLLGSLEVAFGRDGLANRCFHVEPIDSCKNQSNARVQSPPLRLTMIA